MDDAIRSALTLKTLDMDDAREAFQDQLQSDEFMARLRADRGKALFVAGTPPASPDLIREHFDHPA